MRVLSAPLCIEVQQIGQQTGEKSETITSVLQANTTLLVICVISVVVFMSILMCVVLMYGRGKLSQKPPNSGSPSSREEILQKEEPRLPRDFMRRVLPHIIKFPLKDNQPSNTL